jgi:hypothetical protein
MLDKGSLTNRTGETAVLLWTLLSEKEYASSENTLFLTRGVPFHGSSTSQDCFDVLPENLGGR